MGWLTFLIVALILWESYKNDKRLKKLEENRGLIYSQSFVIDVLGDVLSNPMLGSIMNIKSSQAGKPFEDWTENDKTKWHKSKDIKTIADRSKLRLVYLASEDGYLVSSSGKILYFVLPDISHRYLYSQIITGDEDGFKDHLEFNLVERHIYNKKNEYTIVISGYLQAKHEGSIFKKPVTTFLFDFPIYNYKKGRPKEEDFKEFGFEIERSGGDDVYDDVFGESHSISTSVKFKKNGSEISFFY